jgi:hypothetical protein
MSDVEKRIAQWRAGLSDSDAIGAADIHELENHLREEMEHLKSLPLSNEEAFLVARHRLGDTAALEHEFEKVDPRRRLIQRLSWGIMGLLLYFAALTLANAASVLPVQLMLVTGLLQPGSHFVYYLGTVMNIVRIATFFVTIFLALWLYARYLRRRTDSRHHALVAAPTLAATALAVGAIVSVGIRILATQIPWRGMMIAPNYRYTELEFQIVAPILLAGFFIVLHRRDRREVPSQP